MRGEAQIEVAKEVEKRGTNCEVAWGVARGESKRAWEGVRGSERGMDSVPTLLITVSLETERGLPLALGNLPGPVAERVQQWREGRGQRKGGEEAKEGWN